MVISLIASEKEEIKYIVDAKNYGLVAAKDATRGFKVASHQAPLFTNSNAFGFTNTISLHCLLGAIRFRRLGFELLEIAT